MSVEGIPLWCGEYRIETEDNAARPTIREVTWSVQPGRGAAPIEDSVSRPDGSNLLKFDIAYGLLIAASSFGDGDARGKVLPSTVTLEGTCAEVRRICIEVYTESPLYRVTECA